MSASLDTSFKIASIVSALIIVPTFAWVWQTNTKVQETTIEMRHIQSMVEEMKTNTTDIRVMQTDIDYIKKNLDFVKTMLQNPKPK